MQKSLFFLLIAAGWTAGAATVSAVSCSVTDVQSAVNAAADGDTVQIPNGSCAWSTGITTTKQIWIRAANYTPTPGGSLTRNVNITNNASVPLFRLSSGNSFSVRISGIKFLEGSATNNHLRLQGSGSKVPLIDDCTFEVKNRFGNNPDVAAIAWISQGGVMWNARIDGVGGGAGGQCCPQGASVFVESPRAWATASTLGSLDTSGTVNAYIEDSTINNIGQAPDLDNNARLVIRYSTLDGVSGLTHGFTSPFGGRHWEYYNNTIRTTTNNRDVAGRYFWARAGHGVFADNTISYQNQGYSTPVLMDSIVENQTGYPQARQVGWGHNGTTSVIDPIYFWNNTGGSTWVTSSPTYIQLNREVYVDVGPKPGYAKYTYPHPLRGGSGPIQPPTNVQTAVR